MAVWYQRSSLPRPSEMYIGGSARVEGNLEGKCEATPKALDERGRINGGFSILLSFNNP